MSDHVKRPDLMRCRTLQGLMMLLFFATSSIEILHAEESKQQPPTLLDQIWPYEMPHKRPLSKQDQEYAEAALMQWVEAYLHHEYEVVDKRFFWDDRKKSKWGPISTWHYSNIGNEDSKWRGVEIEQLWHSPGFDLVRLWKVDIDGADHYFAVTMTKKPVPGTRGRRLMARFELKKID